MHVRHRIGFRTDVASHYDFQARDVPPVKQMQSASVGGKFERYLNYSATEDDMTVNTLFKVAEMTPNARNLLIQGVLKESRIKLEPGMVRRAYGASMGDYWSRDKGNETPDEEVNSGELDERALLVGRTHN